MSTERAATVDALNLTLDMQREVTSLRHMIANLDLSAQGALARGVTFGPKAQAIADAMRAAAVELEGASAIVRDAMEEVRELRLREQCAYALKIAREQEASS